MSKCILCQEKEAVTREHKYLRSLCKVLFNSANDQEYCDKIVFLQDKNILTRYDEVQSSTSDILTFGKVLCKECNGSRTQKLDNSFQELAEISMKYSQNYDKSRGYITFNNINLINYSKRYMLKVLVCRMNEKEYDVPELLRKIILDGECLDKVKLLMRYDNNTKFYTFCEMGDLIVDLNSNLFELSNYKIHNLFFTISVRLQ